MERTKQAIVIVAGGLMLSACQSTGGMARMADTGASVQRQDEQMVEAQVRLAIGKRALAERNYAAAIVALQGAARDPMLAAEAHNALGVAYGGIGRHDLAGRYFKLASNEDPSVEKYRDNFVRALVADRRARLALLEEPRVPVAPIASPPPASAPRAIAVSVLRQGALRPAPAASGARLVRQSSAGVSLATLSGEATVRAPRSKQAMPVVFAQRHDDKPASPAPDAPNVPQSPAAKAVLPVALGQVGSRTVMVAMSSGSADDRPPSAISSSGRLIPSPPPHSLDQRRASTFAEVFAPMLRSEVHSLGLRPNVAPVSPDLEGIQPVEERLAVAIR